MGCHTSFWSKKPTKTSSMMATNPAACDATDKNAVIGVGAPSYVSGAHVWNGTADTLKANPTTMNMIASVVTGALPSLARYASIPVSSVVPDNPYSRDIPYNITPE